MKEHNRIIDQILDEIEKYPTVIISRHRWPDGDAYGSSNGLLQMLRHMFKDNKDNPHRFFLINDDQSAIGQYFPAEDKQLSDEDYKGALCIILDTATEERISNSKYKLADKVICIDHHPTEKTWADIVWSDPSFAACSEMIVELAKANYMSVFWINSEAAKALYFGIVSDTGRFRFSNVTVSTFEAAAICMDAGINTDEIYENLYTESLQQIKAKARILQMFDITEHGVAYIILDRYIREQLELTEEQVGNAVQEVYEAETSHIKECPIWVGFVEQEDGTWRCRLRSRGIGVEPIATAHRGGGHLHAAGCVAKNWAECSQILRELDKLLEDN